MTGKEQAQNVLLFIHRSHRTVAAKTFNFYGNTFAIFFCPNKAFCA